MKLNEYEEKIRNEQYDIPNVLSKVETLAYNKTYSVESTKSIPLYKRPIFKFATIVLVLAIIVTVTLILTSNNNTYDHKYETVDDKQNLSKVLTNTSNYQRTRRRFTFTCAKGGYDDVINTDNQQAPTTLKPETNNSDTNNQVSGISEPEIVKYDDNYIYYMFYRELIIYKRDTNISYYKTIYIDKEITVNSSKILISDNYLILYYSYLEYRPYTEVYIYDTTNEFTLIENYKITGTYQDARLMDKTLYLVTLESLYNTTDKLPEYTLNDKTYSTDLDNVIYITNANNIGFTTVATINLETLSIHTSCQLGSANYISIYMSENKIYLASNIYNGKRETFETTIYIYNVTNKDTSFYAFTTFDGQILDQYSLDEYNGYLRVASSNTKAEINYYNSIQVFDLNNVNNESREIKRVGLLNEGLGKPYQTIKSATFDKDKASVVTYYNRDPLYDIDLSDPYNPKIVGTFEAPGYSSYLYKFNDTYMLGIGYDDSFSPKISLYHNNTPDKTYVNYGKDLLFTIFENYQYFPSYAFSTPRELMFVTIDNIMTFGLPIHTYDYILGVYKFEYWIFQIDLNNNYPIQLKLKIDQDTFGNKSYDSYYIGSNPMYWDSRSYAQKAARYGVLRALYLDNEFIGITAEGVVVYDKHFNHLYTVENQKVEE